MKKHVKLIAIFFWAFFVFACGKDDDETLARVEVESIEFEGGIYSIFELEKLNLSKYLRVLPEELADTVTVEWHSSDETVAIVSSKGRVTGVQEGEAIISATVLGKTAKCNVEVSKISIKDFSIPSNVEGLIVGLSDKVKVEITPENANPANIQWNSSSSDLTITKEVDGSITIDAKKPGEYTITASYKGIVRTCTVKAEYQQMTGLTLSESELTLKPKKSRTLKAIISPANTYDKSLTWTSSNSKVVTVSNDGEVIAVGIGSAIVTVSHGSLKATCEVNVENGFVMYVQDVYAITGRGVVLSGTIYDGTVRVGDQVTVYTLRGQVREHTVLDMEQHRTLITSATKGEEVGLLIDCQEKNLYEHGDCVASVELEPTGRITGSLSVKSDYSTNQIETGEVYYCWVKTGDFPGTFSNLGGNILKAGESRNGAIFTLESGYKAVVFPGQELSVRKEGRTWAVLTVD